MTKWMTREIVTREFRDCMDDETDYAITMSRDKAMRDGVQLLGEPKITWTKMDRLAVEMYYMHLNRVDPGRWEPPVQPSWPVQVGDWILDVIWNAQHAPPAFDSMREMAPNRCRISHVHRLGDHCCVHALDGLDNVARLVGIELAPGGRAAQAEGRRTGSQRNSGSA
jgi:hypothetical protein